MDRPSYFVSLIIVSAALFSIGPLAPLLSPQTHELLHAVLIIGAVLSFIYAAAVALGFHLPDAAFLDSVSVWHGIILGLAALCLYIVGRGKALRGNDASQPAQHSQPPPPYSSFFFRSGRHLAKAANAVVVFWQALKQTVGWPGHFDLAVSERFRQAAEARAGSYPPLAPRSQRTDLASEDIPIAAAGGPMLLKIKKSQTTNFWGHVVFIIDARMEISAEEHGFVGKYRLGDLLIYSSTARDKHLEAMKANAEGTKGNPVFTMSVKAQLMGVLRTFFSLAMAGAHATMAAYHLKITVYKLLRGVHVRCKDMNEVLVAKNAIVEAGQNLRTYLDVAQSFDGTEEIHEF